MEILTTPRSVGCYRMDTKYVLLCDRKGIRSREDGRENSVSERTRDLDTDGIH